MPSTASPFGMEPAWNDSGGTLRTVALQAGIASDYTTPIYINAPVKIVTGGTLEVTDGNDAIIGSFAGCDYTDSSGKFHTGYWPGTTGNTVLNAYYYDAQGVYYRVQSDATLSAASVGDQADITSPTAGSALTGLSTCTLGTLVGAGVQGTLGVVSLDTTPDNNWGDTYVNVIVRVARYQYAVPQTAI